MKIEKVTDRNTIFTANESEDSTVTTGIIRGKAHNFIIDTGTGGDFAQAMIDSLADSSLPIIVINTHHHWDHVYGNWKFEGNNIIAHKLCAEYMDEKWEKDLARVKEQGSILLGEVRKYLPNQLIDAPLHFPEDGVTIFLNPGHTLDCISIYDEIDKVLYVGDNFGVDEDGFCYWGHDDSNDPEDISEEEEDGLYFVSLMKMIELYGAYDFESAVLTHGGHVPKADFDEYREEMEEYARNGFKD